MDEPDRIWDRDLTLLFIKLVRDFPCLYDSQDPTYSDKIHKRQVLMYLAKELSGECPSMTVQSIKRKLRTLHEQVKRERVKIQRAQEENYRYRPTLWCYHEVSFMWKDAESRIKKNDVVEDAEDDTTLNENSGNGWKANTCSSDVSETETNSYDWKPTAKGNVKATKKRKVQNEDTEQDNNAEFISTLPSSSKEVNPSSTAPFDWTANNEMHGRSGGSHEFVSTTNNQQENSTSTDAVLETLKVCKVLLQQQQREKPNIQNREEIFCNYLCTEIKKVTSDKIFQKLKLDILQLVNNALEENRFQTGNRTIIQEIKVEPEIIIDSSNH